MVQHRWATDNSIFHKAIRKYGWENFTKELIECNLSNEKASEREEYWIRHFDSVKKGYNTLYSDRDNPSFNLEIVRKRTLKLLNDPEINSKLAHKGENNPHARYTTQDVIEIRKRRMNGERLSVVYEDYKHIDNNAGARNGFSKIWLHVSWVDVLPEYRGKYPVKPFGEYSPIVKNNLTEEDHIRLKELLKSDKKYNELYPEFKSRIDWNSFQKICKEYK